MKVIFETNDGKTLDTNVIKYITIDNVEYAILPVIAKKKQLQSTDAHLPTLESFFNVSKKKRVFAQSVANRVRTWFSSNPDIGDTETFRAPTDYAIRVAAENLNRKVAIRQLRKNMYRATYIKPQQYARSKRRNA
jgi:hypothetical protein